MQSINRYKLMLKKNSAFRNHDGQIISEFVIFNSRTDKFKYIFFPLFIEKILTNTLFIQTDEIYFFSER